MTSDDGRRRVKAVKIEINQAADGKVGRRRDASTIAFPDCAKRRLRPMRKIDQFCKSEFKLRPLENKYRVDSDLI